MGRHEAPDQTLSDRFLAVIRPREPKHKIDGSEYVEMMWRMVRALEARTIEDPELLTQAVALAQRLSEVANVAIAANAERFAIDARRGASMAECARILGISKQSASERRAAGNRIMEARIEAAGAVKFSEAKREREAIERAAEHAVVSLTDWRQRRSA